MQDVISMHTPSGDGTTDTGRVTSPMDIQLAKVISHLAKNDPGALAGVLQALGSGGTASLPSGASAAVPASNRTNVPTASDSSVMPTPTPAAQASLFYTEGSLLQPNNQVRHDSVPRFDIQSASNIRANWAASRGGRRSTTGRSSVPRAAPAESRPAEVPQAPAKVVPQPLAKDHAVGLKNQPSGALVYVPASDIFSQYSPWTHEKLDILRKLCRRKEFLGYPCFTYGMTVEEVRREVAKCLPEVPELENIDYYWIGALGDPLELYNGPRGLSTAARNLDRFFEDGGLTIITPVQEIFGGFGVVQDFLEDWKMAVAVYEIKQARGHKNDLFVTRVLGKEAGEECVRRRQIGLPSPADARNSLQQRLGLQGGGNQPRSPALLPPVPEDSVAAESLGTGGVLGPPLALSETSCEGSTAPGPAQTKKDSRKGRRSMGNGPMSSAANTGSPVDLTTPSTRGRQTPKAKKHRIEWSPLFPEHHETNPRKTRNSARAGVINNAESAGPQ